MMNFRRLLGMLLNTTNPVHTGTCEASGQVTMIDGWSDIQTSTYRSSGAMKIQWS